METERRKILDMLHENVITSDEAEELLKILEEAHEDEKKFFKRFKKNVVAKLELIKEGLIKIKNKLQEKINKTELGKVRDNLVNQLKKIDEEIARIDKLILEKSKSFFDKFKSKKKEEKYDDLDAKDIDIKYEE